MGIFDKIKNYFYRNKNIKNSEIPFHQSPEVEQNLNKTYKIVLENTFNRTLTSDEISRLNSIIRANVFSSPDIILRESTVSEIFGRALSLEESNQLQITQKSLEHFQRWTEKRDINISTRSQADGGSYR